ncbi:MAG: hypothetical protein IKU11_02485 [Clostridia bacterium]|nr:hypothetical protein [Clostridia bacterium]
MKYSFVKGLIACALSLSMVAGMSSCSSRVEKDNSGSETQNENKMDALEVRYDWNNILTSAMGTGGMQEGDIPEYYLLSDAVTKTNQTNTMTEGVRVMSERVKLVDLSDSDIMGVINGVVQNAQTALENDLTWVSADDIEKIGKEYETGTVVEPLNYVSSAGTVFGQLYSVNIIYDRSYQLSDEEGMHIGEIAVSEGRALFNFDLRTGRVLKLQDLFYDNVDYIKLLTEKMDRIGREQGYSFKSSLRGLPEEYDMFCISGDGLVIGLPEENVFTESETWYSILLSDVIAYMAVDPESSRELFEESTGFSKCAFDVAGIAYQEYETQPPYEGDPLKLPLVSGISTSETINQNLIAWYQEITHADYYAGMDLSKGGSFSVEVASPINMVNVTVFVYLPAENRYLTLARCYRADTGSIMKAGDLIRDAAKAELPPEALETTNFRVGYDYTLGIPAQNGIEEDVVLAENQLNM